MKILFLSALDFKDKSIQVIRKTPEAYARRGWQVRYIVARDTCRHGNYAYEDVIDPPGVVVTRFRLPFAWLRNRTRGPVRTLLNKVAAWLGTCRLAWEGLREVRRHGPYHVIYGYECHGVLAAALLRLALGLTFRRRPIRYVSRFQGIWCLCQAMEERDYVRLARRADVVLAAFLPHDLCIMTNDGTKGLAFLRWIRTRTKNIRFYVNGVDPPARLPAGEGRDWRALGVHDNDVVILCVSRLVQGKRVERAIKGLAEILRRAPEAASRERIKLVIVGEGAQRRALQRLAAELGVDANAVFVGAVRQEEVSRFLQRADYFFSFYDVSNVGNPLLEAIRHHKIIFTLRNGDTGSWIQHEQNGFLFDPDDSSLCERVAATFWSVHANPARRAAVAAGVAALDREKLWTWDERLRAEIESVEALHAA